MTQIRTTLFALTATLLASLALAQDPAFSGENFRNLLANELDAFVIECPIEGPYDCARLDFEANFVAELISTAMSGYADIRPMIPWELNDGNYSRGYILSDGIDSYVYLITVTDVLSSERESTIIIDRIGVWRGDEQIQ